MEAGEEGSEMPVLLGVEDTERPVEMGEESSSGIRYLLRVSIVRVL